MIQFCRSRWPRSISAGGSCVLVLHSIEILSSHDYPLPVAKLLGEAVVLATLLGSSLKFDGRFILQTKTDGPVRMLVVDYVTSGQRARLRKL